MTQPPAESPRRGLLIAAALLVLVVAGVLWLGGPAIGVPGAQAGASPAASALPAPTKSVAAHGASPQAPAGHPPAAPPQPPSQAQAQTASAAAPVAPRPSPKKGQRIDYSSIDERTRNLFYRQFKSQRGAEVERCIEAYRPPSLEELKQKARHERHSEPPIGAPFTWVHVQLEIDFEPYTDGYAFGRVDASTTELNFVGPDDGWTVALDEPALADCIARAYSDVRVPVRGVTAGPSSKLIMRQTLTLPVNPQ